MLTSFFGKSKPINYILLSVAIIIGYFFGVLTAQEQSLSLGSLSSHGLVIFLMVFAVLLLDFIIRKNNVTKNNTFAILLFVLFVLLVPEVYNDPKLILANIFVLLATRRILSLTTEKIPLKKYLMPLCTSPWRLFATDGQSYFLWCYTPQLQTKLNLL